MENASYIESGSNDSLLTDEESMETDVNIRDEEEYTPKLFSEEQYSEEGVEVENNEAIENETVELFDQDTSEEEDFEIPAFLRKQKF